MTVGFTYTPTISTVDRFNYFISMEACGECNVCIQSPHTGVGGMVLKGKVEGGVISTRYKGRWYKRDRVGSNVHRTDLHHII